MSTPAGWYDDGSGRQRWWDGQQWTENYAPETPAASTTPAVPPAAPQTSAMPQVPAAPGAAPYGVSSASDYSAGPTPPPPSGPSVVGWIALGVAVLGFITACIPPVFGLGWFLLFAAFVLSIVGFFLRGKKWAPIVAICLSVVGAIVGGIIAVIFFTVAFASTVEDYASSAPLPSSSAEADDDSDAESTGDRPSADEVTEGLRAIVGAQGASGYDDEIFACLSQELVDNPEVSDETLTAIASGESEFSDPTVVTEFSSGLTDAISVCAPELQ